MFTNDNKISLMHPECINLVKPVTRFFTKLNKQSIQGEPTKVVSHIKKGENNGITITLN